MTRAHAFWLWLSNKGAYYFFIFVAIVVFLVAALVIKSRNELLSESRKTPVAPVAKVKPAIDSSCSVNGRGEVTCTFRNLGGVAEGACAYIGLRRIDADDRRGLENYIIGGPVCSGVIQARDIRQTSQFISFVTKSGAKYTPSEFCSKHGASGWTEVCTVHTELER